jgi:hypothetical protein
MDGQFRKYEKIHRYGKEETDGILEGTCYIQEKIDGANTSIFLDVDRNIMLASRNQVIGNVDSEWRGFPEYIKYHKGIAECLTDNPGYRLYGEYLCKHTIHYNEASYGKFYLFDIHDGEGFLGVEKVYKIAEKYNITSVHHIDKIENPTAEQLKQFLGKSVLGDAGEDIVIKNEAFVNKFGSRVCAKMVTKDFLENSAAIFGGNNKHAENYWEQYVVLKYVTRARVKKIMDKLAPVINERYDMKHIPRVTNTVYHDMLTEEIWEIQKKAPELRFKALKRITMKRAKVLFVDIITAGG